MTGCRLLLAAPAFLLLMQLALVLHHHHTFSFHDDEDSLHSFSPSVYLDHVKQELFGLASSATSDLDTICPYNRRLGSRCVPTTILIVESSHSRAPPDRSAT